MNQHPQRPASYKGRPGSTADLAMGHLETCGPTGEIALASAIDKEVHELGALLAWPIKQGALKKEVVGDEWVYSMGDGVPVAPARETIERAATKAIEKASKTENTPKRGLTAMQARGEVMESEGCASPTGRGRDAAPARAAGPASIPPRRSSQHVLKAEAARPDATDRETPANTSPVVGPIGAGQPADAGPTADALSDEFRIALWSDGVLDIRRPGGHLVRFTRAEARKLVTYLEAISLDPLREEVTAS